MKIMPLESPINVKIALSKDRIYEADISKELNIDTRKLKEELLNQPAKYAWWSVLSDLAEKKVEMAVERLSLLSVDDECYTNALANYIDACKQYDLLYCTRQAFNHRKTALLQLWGNHEQSDVVQEYQLNISNLRALSA